jgi:hypothetical protein
MQSLTQNAEQSFGEKYTATYLKRHNHKDPNWQKPWWNFLGNIECLSYTEAEDLLQLIVAGNGIVKREKNLLSIKKENLVYVCKPMYDLELIWSEDHAVDSIILDTYLDGDKIKSNLIFLSRVNSITQILDLAIV